MMRALWTAGMSMTTQQVNVDVISNNLANVNTTAYKKKRVEFKDLFYETMNRAYTLDGKGRPVNLQVGHGSMVVATVNNYAPGNYEKTDNTLDFAIMGDGFFKARGANGDVVYTRDGNLKVSVTPDGKKLTTSDGYPILDENDADIYLDFDIAKLSVANNGDISYLDAATGTSVPTGQKLAIVKFPNSQGLANMGSNFYSMSEASGEPEPISGEYQETTIAQGFLEASNVQIVEEMVKLIVAQRAYEINSKAVQSADEMLGMANNLRR